MADNQRKRKASGSASASAEPVRIRITQNGKSRNYIKFLEIQLLTTSETTASVTIYGTGRATEKVVSVAEVLKTLVGELQQVSAISSTINAEDNEVETTLSITLTKTTNE